MDSPAPEDKRGLFAPRKTGRTREKAQEAPRAGHEAHASRRPSLRDDVAGIDQEILRLLLRRHNLLSRMRRKKGFLDPGEEKFLRESWQRAVSKVSRDAELSGRFFGMMQDLSFLPKPENLAEEGAESGPKADIRREAFNLAPPPCPVDIALDAPLSDWASSAWLYLAAASGQEITLAPCLLNDSQLDFLRALNLLGAALSREGQAILAKAAAPLERGDKVLHLGESIWNFYLLLAHYLGRPSRAKFMGDGPLKYADFSALGHFLPQLGARLVHVVPHSLGLPARMECSGILPALCLYPAELPAGFACALLLAAPFYEQPFSLDLTAHPKADEILGRILPLLEKAGIEAACAQKRVNIQPCSAKLPQRPRLGLEVELAACLLAFAAISGGKVSLKGVWPDWPEALAMRQVFQALGVALTENAGCIAASLERPIAKARLAEFPQGILQLLPASLAPIAVALAASVALRGGEASLPNLSAQNPSDANSSGQDSFGQDSSGKDASGQDGLGAGPCVWDQEISGDFLRILGIVQDERGQILAEAGERRHGLIWNAPSPAWALALALAASARGKGKPGFLLGNPGIMTALYPGFWALYNALPQVRKSEKPAESTKASPGRRRIRTELVTIPPKLPDEE